MVDNKINDRLGHALEWCRERNIKNRLDLFGQGSKKKPININVLGIKDATHRLSCCQAIGINRVNYWMDCIVLKEIPNDRLKILVFGERNWELNKDKRKIRYVAKYRVKIKNDFNK